MPTDLFDDLQGGVAVVTGGGRGLGLEMADALAAAGMHVALLDRQADPDLADRLAQAHGVTALSLAADVTDEATLVAAVDRVRTSLGVPTALVNAAGIAIHGGGLEMSADEFRQVLDVNTTGTFLASRVVANAVREGDGRASIVNVSSMSATIVNTPQQQSAYNASKAAVDQLTRSLAVEWIEHGIRVNAVAPGYFASDMTRQFVQDNPELGRSWVDRIPAGRMGEPADLRGLVTFLASDASRYVVGASIVIDGGYTLV